jgi:hypothetical protein
MYPPDPIEESRKRREADAKRFVEMDFDSCQLCGAHGADKRTIFIDCLYVVSEAVPEAIDIHNLAHDFHKSGYLLRVCKKCRGSFLQHLGQWRNECVERRSLNKDHDGCEIEESADA